ncbi:MAG: hypothetical protein V3S25_09675 [Nitrospirales bacterium]
MRQLRDMWMVIAVVLAFGLGTVACSGTMVSSTPMTTASGVGTAKMVMPTDRMTGPAFRTVSGKLMRIKGPYYDVLEWNGSRVRLHVSKKTVLVNGRKKVGQMIRAEITRGGHANSIQ